MAATAHVGWSGFRAGVESFAYIGKSDRTVCQRVADELAISLTLGMILRPLWSLARRHNITPRGVPNA
jgi:hypothetical protein